MHKIFRLLSIKTRITGIVLLLFVGSCWVLTFAIERNLRERMISLLEAQQLSTISYIAADIDAKIQQRIDLIQQNAPLIADHMESPGRAREFLKSRIGLQALFKAGLVVVDKNGRGISDYPVVADREHASFSELEYFQEAITTGRTAIGKPRIGRFTGKPGVAIAEPVRDASGRIKGVLVGVATLSDKNLFGQVEQGKVGESGWIVISSPRDRIIVTSSDPARVLQPMPMPGVSRMLDRIIAGYEGSGLSMSQKGIESLVSAKRIPSAGWVAHMALPTAEAFAPIREMARNAYGLATVLTLLTTLIMWALIRQTLKPLDKATARIHAMATGNREIHTLEPDGGREIQDLLTSFNTLVDQRKRTEDELRASRQFVQTTLDGLAAHICVLDKDGTILAANRAWREFAAANAGMPLSINEGDNYLAACEGVTGGAEDESRRIAENLKNVLTGQGDSFEVEYPCHSPEQQHWFLVRISRLAGDGAVRIVVAHEDITERKRAEDAVKKSEQRLREAQQVAQLGSWELDLATRVLTWSDEIFDIFEIDSANFSASYEAFIAAIHPEDRERVDQAFARSVKNHLPYEIDHRLLLPDGTIKYVHERGETSYAPDGTPLRSTGTVQDVTLSALNELALKESEERFRTIADYTYGWEYWQGLQGEFLYISPSCRDITGYSREEFCSSKSLLYDIILPEDRAIMDSHIVSIHHEDKSSLDYRIMRKDGEIRWIAHGCRAVYSKDGRFLGRRASNRDITDRKNAEAQVQQLAYFDTLTGLPNRRMLLDRLDQALSQAKRHERALAIMFLDLDNFKKINDTLGHDTGDELLKEVAVRLKTCVRGGDTVARQGGDEFIIVLAEIAEPGDAARVAEKIVAVLGDPVCVAQHALQVTTSIGIAVYPVNGTDDVREMLKKADKAMYEAKVAGRNGYRFFSG